MIDAHRKSDLNPINFNLKVVFVDRNEGAFSAKES